MINKVIQTIFLLGVVACVKSSASPEGVPPIPVHMPERVVMAPSATAAVVSEPPPATSFATNAPPRVGDHTVCPVTGEKFTVAANTETATYNGRIYAFCCAECHEPFLADPKKYVKN